MPADITAESRNEMWENGNDEGFKHLTVLQGISQYVDGAFSWSMSNC
jgi:hypothetical protein